MGPRQERKTSSDRNLKPHPRILEVLRGAQHMKKKAPRTIHSNCFLALFNIQLSDGLQKVLGSVLLLVLVACSICSARLLAKSSYSSQRQRPTPCDTLFQEPGSWSHFPRHLGTQTPSSLFLFRSPKARKPESEGSLKDSLLNPLRKPLPTSDSLLRPSLNPET